MNRIGWCSMTWNPCWGCLNDCPYCYARAIAKRFGKGMAENECYYRYENNIGINPYTKRAFIKCTEELRNFKPTFLYSQFNKRFPQKTQKIFVGSMSEIYYWEQKWIERVIEKVKQYPQHIFIFLTKHPEIYDKFYWPMNCWLGETAIKVEDFVRETPGGFLPDDNINFLCIEPMLEEIDPMLFSEGYLDWVIIGAETGNRKNKIIPKKEWIINIIDCCRDKNIPIYLKDNLKEIYPEEIKEFPIGR